MMTNDAYALVTKTYSGDIEPFRELCASIDHHMPGITHHVIVERHEFQLFAQFASAVRLIHIAEDLFPKSLRFTFRGNQYHLLPITPPIRGWIWQQLVKLAFCAKADEKVLVLIDSDAVFIRPISRDSLRRDGRVRLFRSAAGTRASQHASWRRVACRLFGLRPSDFGEADYISQAVTWSPPVVRAMLARIAKRTRVPWYMALAWNFRFSEYILYGIFCEYADPAQLSEVYLDREELCHCSWHYRLDESDLATFHHELKPHHVAVLIQSNLGMHEQTRKRILAGFADL